MGYLKINTENTGEVIIDGARILYVKKSGQSSIHLITNLVNGLGQIVINGSKITEATKQKFNEAVIDTQGGGAVAVIPSEGEVFTSVSVNPA